MQEVDRWAECSGEFNAVLSSIELLRDMGLQVSIRNADNIQVPIGDLHSMLYNYFGIDQAALEKERVALLTKGDADEDNS